MNSEEKAAFEMATAEVVAEHDFRNINWGFLGAAGTQALTEVIKPDDQELIDAAHKSAIAPSRNALICYILELEQPGITKTIVNRAEEIKLAGQTPDKNQGSRGTEDPDKKPWSGVSDFVLKASILMMPPWFRRRTQ